MMGWVVWGMAVRRVTALSVVLRRCGRLYGADWMRTPPLSRTTDSPGRAKSCMWRGQSVGARGQAQAVGAGRDA